MPEISMPSWLNAKPASEGLLDAISVGNQEERMRVSNFAELQRLKMQKVDFDQRQEQARALMPLVLKEQQFKTDMASLKMQMTQQQWQDELNAGKGMSDLSTMQNFLTDFNKWGTDEGEVALSSLEVKYPGIGKHPMYKEAKTWNANAARSRDRIQQIREAGEIRTDVANIRADAQVESADIRSKSSSPQFKSQALQREYQDLRDAALTGDATAIDNFDAWKKINKINAPTMADIADKFRLSDEAKLIQKEYSAGLGSIDRDYNLSPTQKTQARKQLESQVKNKLETERKIFIDQHIKAGMTTGQAAPKFDTGKIYRQNGVNYIWDGYKMVPK